MITKNSDNITYKNSVMNKQSFLLLLLGLSTAFAFISCKKDIHEEAPTNNMAAYNARVGHEIKKNVYYGPAIPLGGGSMRSVYSMNPSGKPMELGVEITASALQSLPAATSTNHAYRFVLPLPQEAMNETPYKHIYLDWNPLGHEPDAIYGVPHFDFHFYTITASQRETIPPYSDISASIFDLFPSPSYLPPGYVPIPGGEQKMGKHWIDPTSSEFNGKPFTYTLIYGTYNGSVIFIEPMITLSTLLSGIDYRLNIPQPEIYAPSNTFYPSQYNIYFNESRQMFYVTLTDFKKQ
jgi:hypothetical protein